MKITPPKDIHPITKVRREELIELVEKIMACEGGEEQMYRRVQIFENNVPHPAASDLIFWPKVDGNSAEEIVDEALSYKPNLL